MTSILRSSALFPNPDFPLRVMRIASHRDTPLHSHEFHELVLILGGRGRHITTTDTHALATGDVFLIRGNTAHGYADTEGMELVNILFHPRKLGLALGELAQLPGYHVLFRIEPKLRQEHGFGVRLHLDAAQLARVAHMTRLLEEELERSAPGCRAMAVAYLTQLICVLSRFYPEAGAPEHVPLLRIGEILSHVERCHHRQIPLAELVQLSAMSESSFLRLFRRAVGVSPIDHVIRVRVAKAQQWLAQPGVRISDVAFRCGFNDSNYFTRQFKRVTGQSPRAYRLRCAKEGKDAGARSGV